jgi:signal transduction histidine kinase
LVRERAERIGPRARAAGSTIAVDCPPSLTGTLDRARIENVIDALLDNAVKFGCGKPIDVSLRADGTWAELSVRDRGMGIPADRLSAIFKPFERVCPTEHFGGLGLGLYMAKAIVDAHGGSIAATSSPGEGATFVMRLPADAHLTVS